MRCKDGEEERLLKFSDYLNAHVDRLEDRVGRVGNERLLLMAALTITGELWEAREKLERLEAGLGKEAEPESAPPAARETLLDDGGEPGIAVDAAEDALRRDSL